MPASAAICFICLFVLVPAGRPDDDVHLARRELRKIFGHRRRNGKLDGHVGIGRRRNAGAADVVRVVEMPDDLETVVGRQPLNELAHPPVADEEQRMSEQVAMARASHQSISFSASISSAFSTAAPAAPRTVLCPNATNL